MASLECLLTLGQNPKAHSPSPGSRLNDQSKPGILQRACKRLTIVPGNEKGGFRCSLDRNGQAVADDRIHAKINRLNMLSLFIAWTVIGLLFGAAISAYLIHSAG